MENNPVSAIESGPQSQLYLQQLGSRIIGSRLVIGIVALVVATCLGESFHDNWRQFLFGYLTAWCFFFCIASSALFFVLAHHLFKASWSVVLRRLAEALSCNFVLLLVLFIPIALGLKELYVWTDASFMGSDQELTNKIGYLNQNFFLIRMAVYFAILIGISIYYYHVSYMQDRNGGVDRILALRKQSGWCFLVVIWVMNLVGADLVMSLQPKWLSYAAPLLFFSGAVMTIYAVLTLMSMWLQRNGRLQNAVTVEHYHDLGKWLFAWMTFWAYICIAQYLLIWYGNVPDETRFFLFRDLGPWGIISIALLAGHFLIPFLGLMSRHVKRNKAALAFWCVWLLFFGYLDMFWQIQPGFWVNTPGLIDWISGQNPYHLMTNAPLQMQQLLWAPLSVKAIVMDILCIVGIGGLFFSHSFYLLRDKPLLPVKDPHLSESLAFENI